MDALRRRQVLRSKLLLLVRPDDAFEEPGPGEQQLGEHRRDEDQNGEHRPDAIPDERLRLIFMCCHPALAHDAQPALTRRLVCGLTTKEIARLFLVPEATMAARLTRAKKKIATARIPFRVPDEHELPDRLRGVLGVIHLLYTTGHTAPSGADLARPELAGQALHLARTLRALLPAEREVQGQGALLLVTPARCGTRVAGEGRLVRREHQDRSKWDRAAIAACST